MFSEGKQGGFKGQGVSAHDLPVPSEAALAHSERLQALIRSEIEQAGGHIGFERFMELALYAPGLGYYSAGSGKFGETGDFVTAPELSPLFSRCLARQCAEVLSGIGGGDILEFGAGSGVMAADILAELARLEALPGQYFILELSADLRQRQQQAIEQKVPQLTGRVVWLDALPEPGFCGVVLANEVLDAMPVHRFVIDNGEPRELCVVWDGEQFELQSGPADAALYTRLKQLQQEYALADGYSSELNLHAEEWVRSLADFLAQGVALLIDYGFPQREFYHPQRSGGTLMCHYRHRVHDDALRLIGLQDITAHVDFTAVGEAALAAGLDVRGYTSQANFLVANGLTELLAGAGGDSRQQLTLSAQVKRLTMPGEMGELFKVMALSREWRRPLQGFSLRDERRKLG
ncbi:MAG: SAM-dependent methyltransferase [Gammaproteobacteria bacterium]|nr:SAM-dependent methyltransferase [Gammaproteobacteria bacterium]MCW8971853.1 SAM-dependent methyltransferase [Gammaproteobacteria bacterium]MCW8994144.1 SAM-dependent methyltransferase [Gammaproteobacteria bacterium]